MAKGGNAQIRRGGVNIALHHQRNRPVRHDRKDTGCRFAMMVMTGIVKIAGCRIIMVIDWLAIASLMIIVMMICIQNHIAEQKMIVIIDVIGNMLNTIKRLRHKSTRIDEHQRQAQRGQPAFQMKGYQPAHRQ